MGLAALAVAASRGLGALALPPAVSARATWRGGRPRRSPPLPFRQTALRARLLGAGRARAREVAFVRAGGQTQTQTLLPSSPRASTGGHDDVPAPIGSVPALRPSVPSPSPTPDQQAVCLVLCSHAVFDRRGNLVG